MFIAESFCHQFQTVDCRTYWKQFERHYSSRLEGLYWTIISLRKASGKHGQFGSLVLSFWASTTIEIIDWTWWDKSTCVFSDCKHYKNTLEGSTGHTNTYDWWPLKTDMHKSYFESIRLSNSWSWRLRKGRMIWQHFIMAKAVLKFTLLEIFGGWWETSKVSGGRYQYVPAPWLVRSMPWLPFWSAILLSPKSCKFDNTEWADPVYRYTVSRPNNTSKLGTTSSF